MSVRTHAMLACSFPFPDDTFQFETLDIAELLNAPTSAAEIENAGKTFGPALAEIGFAILTGLVPPSLPRLLGSSSHCPSILHPETRCSPALPRPLPPLTARVRAPRGVHDSGCSHGIDAELFKRTHTRIEAFFAELTAEQKERYKVRGDGKTGETGSKTSPLPPKTLPIGADCWRHRRTDSRADHDGWAQCWRRRRDLPSGRGNVHVWIHSSCGGVAVDWQQPAVGRATEVLWLWDVRMYHCLTKHLPVWRRLPRHREKDRSTKASLESRKRATCTRTRSRAGFSAAGPSCCRKDALSATCSPSSGPTRTTSSSSARWLPRFKHWSSHSPGRFCPTSGQIRTPLTKSL